jgi:hypothetical protein
MKVVGSGILRLRMLSIQRDCCVAKLAVQRGVASKDA